ncbi:DNA-binding domain-containing protein [Spirulina sp. 06S082]|uniref:DNA-binding domain-containing protein n=1 Tax=Spirulina sp. 06S082 TaxID=3110248 RepID=UPI002B20C100|nr:DNA-binding domain-containing protein [Spirulina sp. 06S082]MEA5472215.1 DNA-binding domain-containing protein [Spirulina sp. 06S082]
MKETSPSLQALQSWMQNALIDPQQASREQIKGIIASSSRLNSTQRLAIYQRSYHIRLLKCMREQFPALCHALGADLFNDFARQYLQTYPSISYTLSDLGKRFPAYLEETRPDRQETSDKRESWIDFMVDLAQFERQLFILFDALGHEGKPFANLHSPDSCLKLQPCFALGDYRFPVAWYYHEVKQNNDPPFPPLQRSPIALIRKNYLTHTFSLTGVQYIFLQALSRGLKIEEAIAVAAREAAQPREQVYRSWAQAGSTRERWLEAGFFIVAD